MHPADRTPTWIRRCGLRSSATTNHSGTAHPIGPATATPRHEHPITGAEWARFRSTRSIIAFSTGSQIGPVRHDRSADKSRPSTGPQSSHPPRKPIGDAGSEPSEDHPIGQLLGRARTAQCRSMNGTRTMAADAGPSQTGTPTPPISYATPTGDRRQGAQLFTDPTGWTLHQLRHTRIRQLKDEGCPLPILHRPPAPHTALTPPTAAWWWCRARCRTGRPAAGPRVARPQRRSRRW